MGIYPYRQDDWTPGFPEAFVLHKFQGTWKTENQAQLHNLSAGDTKRPRRQGHLYRRAAMVHLSPEYLNEKLHMMDIQARRVALICITSNAMHAEGGVSSCTKLSYRQSPHTSLLEIL